MGIEVLRGSESVAEPIQTDVEMARLSALIDGRPAAVSKDDTSLHTRRRQPTWFQALFLGLADDCSPLALETVDLLASEPSTAMREAITMPWPPQAIGFRLLDLRPIGGAKGDG